MAHDLPSGPDTFGLECLCAVFGQANAKKVRGKKLFLNLGLAALVVAMAAVAVQRFEAVSFVAGVVTVLVSLMIWLAVVQRLGLLRLAPQPGGIVLGLRTLSLETDGLHHRAETNEALYRWGAIQSVEMTDRHVFVLVDANAAVIIPKSALAGEAQLAEFLSQIQIRTQPAAIPPKI